VREKRKKKKEIEKEKRESGKEKRTKRTKRTKKRKKKTTKKKENKKSTKKKNEKGNEQNEERSTPISNEGGFLYLFQRQHLPQNESKQKRKQIFQFLFCEKKEKKRERGLERTQIFSLRGE